MFVMKQRLGDSKSSFLFFVSTHFCRNIFKVHSHMCGFIISTVSLKDAVLIALFDTLSYNGCRCV